MQAKLKKTLIAAIEALDACGLRYAIVGGLAVGAWGVRRGTQDVDLHAELPDARRPQLKRELEARGFHVPAMEEELLRFGVFRSRSKDQVFLDVFNAVGFGETILDRRKSIRVDGCDMWFATAEDILLLKAFSDRERDFDDLVKLTSVLGSSLDKAYVDDWVAQLDESIGSDEVSRRWQQAWRRRTKSGK